MKRIRAKVIRPNAVYGVGTNDVEHPCGNQGAMWKPYDRWRHILWRCYCEKSRHKNPTYKDCTVCDEWLLFSNFLKWYNENYVEGYAIDKDILAKGSRVYSPETCCFVPQEINSLIVKADKVRGDLPIGVSYKGKKFIARCSPNKNLSLGTYDTPEEAFQAYKVAKENHIKEIAKKYYSEGKITERVYNALMNYKVEITD